MYTVSEVRCYIFQRKYGPNLNKLLANQPPPLELMARLGLELTGNQLLLHQQNHQTNKETYTELPSIKLIQVSDKIITAV